ncbi:fasciclin-2-like [Babylonia areolata]|uniref:fasciclin-2-like n=1 Tax=Babylonia areolata TaxID=304850 RepID=UPI003FD5F1F4
MCLVSLHGQYSEEEEEVQALEGAVGLLQCPVFTYGSGQRVTWTKQGVEVSKLDSRLSVNQRSGALRIHRAHFLDSGRYTCSVRDHNRTVSRDTHLKVVSYPKITLTQNATVTRNTTASLLCKVESLPMSHITWKRHRIPVAHLSSVKVKKGDAISGAEPRTTHIKGIPSQTISQLLFPSVQPHHAGLYECLAANTPGTARATLSLRVMYAPIAEIAEKEVVGWPGRVPDLHLKFKADPSPRITCRHKPLGPSRDPAISDVNHTDINVIDAGEATATVQLLKGRIPKAPEVAVDSLKPSWLVLKLRMPSDMGLPPADRIIARYEDMTDPEGEIIEFDKAVTAKASNSSQNWNLTGLTPGHEYHVTLQLANAIATSNISLLRTTLPLYAPPEPVQFTSDPQGVYPRAYVLSWLPPATHGAELTGYTLTYVPVTVTDGRNGPHILEVAGPEHRVKVQRSAKTIVISGLQHATFYRATMVAHSHVGQSQLSTFLFTTANNTETGQ